MPPPTLPHIPSHPDERSITPQLILKILFLKFAYTAYTKA